MSVSKVYRISWSFCSDYCVLCRYVSLSTQSYNCKLSYQCTWKIAIQNARRLGCWRTVAYRAPSKSVDWMCSHVQRSILLTSYSFQNLWHRCINPDPQTVLCCNCSGYTRDRPSSRQRTRDEQSHLSTASMKSHNMYYLVFVGWGVGCD